MSSTTSIPTPAKTTKPLTLRPRDKSMLKLRSLGYTTEADLKSLQPYKIPKEPDPKIKHTAPGISDFFVIDGG